MTLVAEYKCFTNPDEGNYPYTYVIEFTERTNQFFSNYAYFKEIDGINLYFEALLSSDALGESYIGFCPDKGNADGSAKVNAADASIVLRYDVDLLDCPISLQTAAANNAVWSTPWTPQNFTV